MWLRLLLNQVSSPEPINDSLTAYHLTKAPANITPPESSAVNRTPILSRMIPAKMRKKTKTLRNVSEPCIVPNASESQPRVDCMRSFIGESMSIKMYEQNMANARSNKAVQRSAAESRRVFVVSILIVFSDI